MGGECSRAVLEVGNPEREIAELWDGRLSDRSRLSSCSNATVPTLRSSSHEMVYGLRCSVRHAMGATTVYVQMHLRAARACGFLPDRSPYGVERFDKNPVRIKRGQVSRAFRAWQLIGPRLAHLLKIPLSAAGRGQFAATAGYFG
jgi:hypothetical protein